MVHLEPVMMVLEAFVSLANPRLHALLASQPSFALSGVFRWDFVLMESSLLCVTQSGAVCRVIHAPDSSAGAHLPASFHPTWWLLGAEVA